MILNENPRRACIYFIYDKDGIIDEYIIRQLIDLRNNVEFIHCVINGKLTSAGQTALAEVADEVYIRENRANDIGAYCAAIKHLGWEKLSAYDELVVMNCTCFGPVYPFKEVFGWANRQDVDFWGLTEDTKTDWLGTKNYLHYNKNKQHYQSYFLVFRRPLLGSKLLMDFFDEIPQDVSYIQSGCFYEYAFPGYFEERGYQGAVYCNLQDDNLYPLLHNPVRLLKEFRMPLFKKRSFFHHFTDVQHYNAGEATARLIHFLEEETDYDMNLVWDSVLRTCNLADVVRCAQLNRVLPRDRIAVPEHKSTLKVGLIYHAYYVDLMDESVAYIQNFPDDAEVLVTTDTEEKKLLIQEKLEDIGRRCKVKVIENRGRDISSLLVGGADFVSRHDLICFVHDKKSPQMQPPNVGRSWAYKLHENVIASKAYVANVIELFERETRLGIAFPAYPNHSVYAQTIGNGWAGNYWNTQRILKDFDVNVKINEHTLCVAPLGTCFWFRPRALDKVFRGYRGDGWSYCDFPREPNRYDQTLLHALERSYAYFAQDAGYYPVYLYNDRYTEIELTSLEFNKTGSADMRRWMDILTMNAIGHTDAVPDTSMVNYGIKESLKHLSVAILCKYPAIWRLLAPVRKIGKLILGVKT